MYLIKPQMLNKGDTIEIIAPAGPVNREKILIAKNLIEELGYRVKFGKYLFDEERYLSSSDNKRLHDLEKAFLSDDTKAILCARGGYGSIRLIDKIDYNIIKNNPKIFCGYSDITALSLMMLKNSNLMTFSGAMAEPDFAAENINKETINSLLETINGNYSTYKAAKVIKQGNACGITWGGNLSTVVSLCGLDFIPDEKFIFFTEDINEPVYKIDKMLRQLINIKEFRNNVSAICFGEFLGVDNREWLFKLQEEIIEELNIPGASGFNFTHSSYKQTVPIGAEAKFDGALHII